MLARRGFLGGLLALAAPAIVRTPGLLMPVRSFDTGMRRLENLTVNEALYPFGRQRVSAYDPNFATEECLAMRMRFARVVNAGIKHLHGAYPEIADAAD